jgi:hypothetical protein
MQSADQKAIDSILSTYVETWTTHDMDAWGRLFTSDADFVTHEGGWWNVALVAIADKPLQTFPNIPAPRWMMGLRGEVHMVVLVMSDPRSRAHEGHLLQDDITTRRVSQPVPQLGREDHPIDAQALALCRGL